MWVPTSAGFGPTVVGHFLEDLYGGLSEFIGGVQAGYNFQAGHFLFGVEG